MTTQEHAIDLVIAERKRQNEKWGFPQHNTPFEWVSILTEEVGEFAQATNDALLGSYPNGDLGKAIEEVIQVAAVAISIIEHLAEVERLTPAQENAYKGSPLRSSHKPIDGVVDAPEDAVQPVFHIGDTIRFKSTGRIEKISTISHGGRFVNGVNSNDVELIKERSERIKDGIE